MPRYSLYQGNMVIEPDQSSAKEIRIYGTKRPVVISEVTKTATTIAFVRNTGAGDTITDSGDGFLTAGFKAGDVIRVSGTTSNDGNYELVTAVAGTLTLHNKHILVAESAGSSFILTTVFHLPEEYQDLLLARAALVLSMKYPRLDIKNEMLALFNNAADELMGKSDTVQDGYRAQYKDI